MSHISRVSCQKGPTHHDYAWQIGPFWQDTLNIHFAGFFQGVIIAAIWHCQSNNRLEYKYKQGWKHNLHHSAEEIYYPTLDIQMNR